MGMSEWEADTLVDECLALQEAAFKDRALLEAADLLILDLREDLRIEQQHAINLAENLQVMDVLYLKTEKKLKKWKYIAKERQGHLDWWHSAGGLGSEPN